MPETAINIRPHLVPYFLKEFEGKEAVYLNRKVSSIKVPASSSLGRWMGMLMLQVENTGRHADYYTLYLTAEITPEGKKYEGNYYRHESGPSSFLTMPEDINKAVNEILEDIFRMSFVAFMDGVMMRPDSSITKGIDYFIDKYELLEVGFSRQSMRQLYFREKKKAG